MHGANDQSESQSISSDDACQSQQQDSRHSQSQTYTVTEAVDSIGLGKYQWALLFYAGLAWLSDAMEMMIISLLGPAVACEWDLSAKEEGAISTVVFVGTLIGANASGALADAYGRRIGFVLTAVLTFVFGLASAVAPSYKWLLVLRFFVGVGLGGAHVPVALYMEFVPSLYRGLMLVALQSFWTVGTMIEAGVGWAVLNPLGWRWLLAISSLPLLILAVLFPVIPESPMWLAAAGRTGEAERVLTKLAAVNKAELPPGCLQHVKASRISGDKGIAVELRALVRNIASIFTQGLALTTALLMATWFSNALIYYSEVLLTTVIQTRTGGSVCTKQSFQISSSDMRDVFLTSFAELPGLIIAALLIDRIGRKKTMFLALSVIFVSTLLLVISPAQTLLKLFLARAASMGGFTALFIYTPEVYPTRVRSFALGLNNSLSRVGAIMAPLVAVNLGAGGHLKAAESIVAAFSIVAAACVLGLPFETSSRSLEEEERITKTTMSDSADGNEAERSCHGLL